MFFGVLQDKCGVQHSGLLGCEGVVLVQWVQTVCSNWVPSNSRDEDITLTEKGTTILRNAGNDRTSDIAAAAPEHNTQLWKPLISLRSQSLLLWPNCVCCYLLTVVLLSLGPVKMSSRCNTFKYVETCALATTYTHPLQHQSLPTLDIT
jgi:hypothetical protein